MMIYIVEDDTNIRELEEYALTSSGFEVKTYSDGENIVSDCIASTPDLLLLDIMLPGEDGISILKKLRANATTKNLPIIMVTAKSSEIDTVKGLDNGADDYITKPFGIMELISRIRALLRRSVLATVSAENIITYGPIVIDEGKHTKMYSFSPENVLLYADEYEYDINWNTLKYQHYDEKDELVEYTEYKYDENGIQTGYVIYDKNGNITETCEY